MISIREKLGRFGATARNSKSIGVTRSQVPVEVVLLPSNNNLISLLSDELLLRILNSLDVKDLIRSREKYNKRSC